jgi:rhodanese-related sulfurtransferase
MGLRTLAKKLVGRVVGGDSKTPAAAPTAAPARAAAPNPSEPVADAGALTRIECGAQELYERLGAGETVVVMDVRTAEEVAQGGIPGAIHVPLDELEARWEVVRDANEVVCYCAMGGRSLKAATFLRSKGIFNATSMEGGIGAWKAAGGKVVPLG